MLIVLWLFHLAIPSALETLMILLLPAHDCKLSLLISLLCNPDWMLGTKLNWLIQFRNLDTQIGC